MQVEIYASNLLHLPDYTIIVRLAFCRNFEFHKPFWKNYEKVQDWSDSSASV